MPREYEKIRDSLLERNPDMSEQEAKRRAAAIWNSQHPDDPVTRNYEETLGGSIEPPSSDHKRRYGEGFTT
jgi:hypothetical protein